MLRNIDFYAEERADATVLPNGLRAWKAIDKHSGKLRGMLFLPKATNPTWDFYFKDDAAFDKKVGEASTNYDAHIARKMAQRISRSTGDPSKMDPGTLLSYSWGYDQTQCDLFQVVRRSGLTVYISRIAAESVRGTQGRDCEHVRAVKDAFIEECGAVLPSGRHCGQSSHNSVHYEASTLFDHTFAPYVPQIKKRILFIDGHPHLSMDCGICSIIPVITFANAEPLVTQTHYTSSYH